MAITPHPLRLARDARGIVFEPVDAAELARQRNCHVVLTEPGCVRGNHWHRHATEITVVLGPARVRIRRAEGGEDVQDVVVPDGQAFRFVFPPGVAHALENTGDRPMLAVAFSDQTHDRSQPDVVAEVLLPPPA